MGYGMIRNDGREMTAKNLSEFTQKRFEIKIILTNSKGENFENAQRFFPRQ